MENLTDEATLDNHPQIALINTFCEITACASKTEALFFLESHNFDLDAAVSTFLDDAGPAAVDLPSPMAHSQSQSHYSPSESPPPSRSRSPSPPPASRSYSLRSAAKPRAEASGSVGQKRGGGGGGGGGIRTLADLSRNPKHEEDSDSDPDFDPQEYYTGGEKSGMLVQDPSKATDIDELFNQARQAGALEASVEHGMPSSSSSRFTGTGRLLSGEVSATPDPPQSVTHTITFWRNGFTVDDGPLRRIDDPENASFIESIRNSEWPKELAPADKRTSVHVNLIRKDEDYKQPKKPKLPFQGVRRTLGSSSDTTPPPTESVSVVTTVLTAAPTPTLGLTVDQNKPCTSIQLRLADGTRLVSRFNRQHTIRDIRGFIDASRPGGSTGYQLQTMGFPPKQLVDLDQTIEEAGIANSVVIQKL
ncbi:Plant UBX domain-containing protein 5 [Striga hermonthica]|uniref:Plant UBX domain-containing protein 5 n=1 Tax=Striga hermonthica TaxID=68872 RepID=A0A9N7RF11_STRHE|nr:Plant UBX domain-containing protein 5 [Striga hermonthica]